MMLQTFLKEHFEKRKKKNSRYSIRSFAKFLEVESSTLSKILKGSRDIKPYTATKIIEKLEADPALKNSLYLSIFPSNNQKYLKEESFTIVKNFDEDLLALWEYYAILSYFELKNVSHDSKKIAEYFGSTTEKVIAILKDLESNGAIKKQGSQWVLQSIQLTTGKGLRSNYLYEVHRQTINKGLEVLEKKLGDEAVDYSGMTTAISQARLPEAIRRIKEFRRSLAAYLNEGEPQDAVYRLNIQLFPLKKV